MSLSYGMVFIAGLISFFSPCILPIFPSFVAYITGVHIKQESKAKHSIYPAVISFLLGFSLVFVMLGLSIGWIGQWLTEYQMWIRRIGGVLLIFWGILMLGIVRPSFLMKTFKFNFMEKHNGTRSVIGAFLIGLTFAAGWTPCIGPVLASVLTLSITEPNQAGIFMLLYIIGFSIPFIVFSAILHRIKGIVRYSNLIMKIGGILFVVMGLLLINNRLAMITAWLINFVK
jgi:cytochrome c-type biogenesis protein